MALLAVAMRDPLPPASVIARVPWWAWSGGVLGAILIGLSILLVPQLGGAAFIALLVTGQMVAALAFDHYGWLGIPERPIDIPRLLGVALLVGRVIMIRK
jgi:transporter family-2 protein